MPKFVFYAAPPRAATTFHIENHPPAAPPRGLAQTQAVSNSTLSVPARSEGAQQKKTKSFFSRLKAVFSGRGTHSPRSAAAPTVRHALALTPQGAAVGRDNAFYGQITFSNIMPKHLPEPSEVTPPSSRTVSEALVDMVALIEASTEIGEITKCEMGGTLRSHFLAGGVSQNSLKNLYTVWAAKYARSTGELLPSIQALVDSADKKLALDKQNDQYYCQLFERELACDLLARPNSGMLQISQNIKDYMLADMACYDEAGQNYISLLVREHMAQDQAEYLTSIPEAAQFIAQPSPFGLINMLNTDSVHAIPLVLATALRYLLCAPQCAKIVNDAHQFYTDVILTSRSLHVASDKDQELGMAGCNNLLNFLFHEIEEQCPGFSMEQATLMTAAYFSFVGGQALNDTFAVFAHHSKQNFKPFSYKALSYNSDVAPAVDHAYQKLVKVSAEIQQLNVNRSQESVA
ncbi:MULTISPECIES: hypothetical protein [unclassified Undibacterium]|uniref:hypothetical protein n=1 Tax=unclassified Undibacterium TaxID=2630295 RepID=UPI002AC8BE86|nr:MULTISPECIES: hypothetical protein [unclassified Undibacterium]MEB0139244.1 hypothetical protein [Undibacterium sp. CCC2.1]MEB0172088.1 hypothetical protein [Undibacterium sp. CCC1.1]MEB0175963.1 hypothetical protein [Undibacterium sp. CCC3.4]MEB0215275.1 hypothetical protein [Undibacterium sp. 5I2]WPX45450.1 hypothetical protein RHM61_09640 [Undibacterium sp. CCC3.4]